MNTFGFSSVGESEVHAKKVIHKPTTLEACHQKKMKEFEEASKSLELLREEVRALESATEEEATRARLVQLRKQIAALERDDARLDYFLKAGPLLFTYFDAQESIAKGVFAPVSKARVPHSVLSYFTEPEEAVATAPPPAVPLSLATGGTVDGFHREKLLDQYMTLVDPESIKGGFLPSTTVEAGWGVCIVCSADMVFHSNEAKLFCATCGNEEFVLVDSEKPSYKDPPREVTYFAYKKINHFNEWLAQFQAKESTYISRPVLDAVLAELRKQRIVDPQKITKDKIREILGRLKMPKLYTHATHIRNLVTQRMTNLTISKELEEKLQHMFKEIQPAFIKHCPPDRSNFISYSLCIYKLFQLLEMDEFLPALQLLKTRAKLFAFDTLWKKICEDLRWEFIPTI